MQNLRRRVFNTSHPRRAVDGLFRGRCCSNSSNEITEASGWRGEDILRTEAVIGLDSDSTFDFFFIYSAR